MNYDCLLHAFGMNWNELSERPQSQKGFLQWLRCRQTIHRYDHQNLKCSIDGVVMHDFNLHGVGSSCCSRWTKCPVNCQESIARLFQKYWKRRGSHYLLLFNYVSLSYAHALMFSFYFFFSCRQWLGRHCLSTRWIFTQSANAFKTDQNSLTFVGGRETPTFLLPFSFFLFSFLVLHARPRFFWLARGILICCCYWQFYARFLVINSIFHPIYATKHGTYVVPPHCLPA